MTSPKKPSGTFSYFHCELGQVYDEIIAYVHDSFIHISRTHTFFAQKKLLGRFWLARLAFGQFKYTFHDWEVVSSIFLYFHPGKLGFHDPIWRLRIFFRWVGEKPPSYPTTLGFQTPKPRFGMTGPPKTIPKTPLGLGWARVDQLLVLGMGDLQPLIGNPKILISWVYRFLLLGWFFPSPIIWK